MTIHPIPAPWLLRKVLSYLWAWLVVTVVLGVLGFVGIVVYEQFCECL